MLINYPGTVVSWCKSVQTRQQKVRDNDWLVSVWSARLGCYIVLEKDELNKLLTNNRSTFAVNMKELGATNSHHHYTDTGRILKTWLYLAA